MDRIILTSADGSVTIGFDPAIVRAVEPYGGYPARMTPDRSLVAVRDGLAPEARWAVRGSPEELRAQFVEAGAVLDESEPPAPPTGEPRNVAG